MGTVAYTVWDENRLELALGTKGRSGGQWDIWEATYSPAGPDGRVDPAKAVTINEQFQVSRQFWSHLVREGLTGSPKEFITPVPHLSFVTGEAGRAYMRARHEALSAEPLFQGLEYTEDTAELARWIPLMMAGRDFGTDGLLRTVRVNWRARCRKGRAHDKTAFTRPHDESTPDAFFDAGVYRGSACATWPRARPAARSPRCGRWRTWTTRRSSTRWCRSVASASGPSR